MRRTYVRRRLGAALLLLLLVVAGVWLVGGVALGTSEAPDPPEPYTVRRGDTLWEIARAHVGPEGDPRPLVSLIADASGLQSSRLVPGMELLVPEAS
jgi:hypothetical protein